MVVIGGSIGAVWARAWPARNDSRAENKTTARRFMTTQNTGAAATANALSRGERHEQDGVSSAMAQRSLAARLAQEGGLVIAKPEALPVRRLRCGKGYRFITAGGAPLQDAERIAWLKSLAVPPAYSNVRYATDQAAHLQAIGQDAAGRLQYRYHPKWAEVREAMRARRLL